MKNSGKTDWDKFNNMEDSGIDYSDIPITGVDFWEDGEVLYPHRKVTIQLKIDEDIAEWLKKMGDKSDIAVNNLLRSYYIGMKNILNPGNHR